MTGENIMADQILQLKTIDSEIQKLIHTAALLSWDQETYMPPAAVDERSEQLALLEGLIHDRITGQRAGELLEGIGLSEDQPDGPDSLDPAQAAFVREFYRRYRRSIKLPKKLVTERARQSALAQRVWVEARKASRFSLFEPNLSTILRLVVETAECLGYDEHIYDPLLDEFEPRMKTSELESVFARFQERLKTLVQRIMAGRPVESSFLKRSYPVEKQRAFSNLVLKAIGYDLKRGRFDISAHPFTTTLGCSDVRLTTRYNEKYFNTGIFGTIHEAGHGLYELGIDTSLCGTLLADGTSMGIHESQSRMWENLIGRSLPFWKHFYPQLKTQFPEALSHIDLEQFYRGINVVRPTLIRVEADEVTYNLHILLRFNLEKKLVCGDLAVKDLPDAWREESVALLGVAAPGDADGVLQDIHWSMGAIGYFPTYSLGNLYSAQFFKVMEKELPEMTRPGGLLERGEFAEILSWLCQKIHRWGKTFPAGELCERISGEPLNPDYFMDYLEQKFSDIYGI